MRLREPCELRRGGMKSEWTRKKSNELEKKSTSGEKFFICQPIFQIFLWLFDLRARALRSLETLDLLLFWLHFSILLLN